MGSGKGDESDPGATGVGQRFQAETKYHPETLGNHVLDWSRRPPGEKHYDGAIRVSLPPPPLPEAKEDSLWTVLARRRSRRLYDAGASIDARQLAQLLWAIQGMTGVRGGTTFRTAPSAGALFPIETYCSCRRVEGIEQGIYHFRPGSFDLELLRAGDFARECAVGALGQAMVADAQAVFVWSAVVARSAWKYRQRAYRYIYLDAGHIAQNLYLAGEALGLGVCGIGAFFDDEMNALLGLDGEKETVIYLASLGVPRLRERE